MTGCYVTHHGITDKRFYSFQRVEVFHEIVSWHDLETKIQQVSDREIRERQAVKSARFIANPPFIEPITGMEFIPIPGGCFEMGCGSWSHDGDLDKKPVHRVCVSSFYMARYEVTQNQWQTIMGSNPSHFSRCGGNCPVEKVSWSDVQNFIKRLNMKSRLQGFRLPTEAEWEYACRSGGKNELYCGGGNIDVLGWYGNNSRLKTHPVGLKQPNGLGLYDMSGNVWEWCSDWYGNYPDISVTDPGGASSGSYRVIRGGGWSGYAQYCRSAERSSGSPGSRHYYLGLRLSRTP
ncbi:MAG: hypothetical protein OMM_05309 [Candidatus Magnetoglobus multicellularis str. Araruama]|uniref:Sulfatase-modifying factor enzyme-like domain-containing protein n=1 Tax=Candidatus Magnetoglobus multicellularis str. Araruama TaxID=890399 RepID=A0A1V1NXA1_9BACT|nr:MAG: hypothetical protein OMM_05309 [Candidatus Magnetoglobus multicellularis str. Araruama]